MKTTSYLLAAVAICATGALVTSAGNSPPVAPAPLVSSVQTTNDALSARVHTQSQSDAVTTTVDTPVPAQNVAMYEIDAPTIRFAAASEPAAKPQFGPERPEADEKQEAIEPRDKMSGQVAQLVASAAAVLQKSLSWYDQHPQLFDDKRVAELGGIVTRSYETLDMRAVQIPVAALEDLAVDENVDWLSLDNAVASFSASSREAANLPSTVSSNVAYSGTGVGIAVIDTGVSNHGDLGDNILQYSFLGGAYPTPVIANGEVVDFADDARQDLFGHGTHVAGILSGDGVGSQDEFKGSATAAKLLALQVLDKNGAGSIPTSWHRWTGC